MLKLSTAVTPALSGVIKKKKAYAGPQTRALQELAVIWGSLSGSERTTWKTLTGQLAQTNVNDVPGKLSPYATFIQFNTILQGSGNAITRTGPTDTTLPYPLPDVTLTGSLSGGANALILHASAAYDPSIIVYAAPPMLAGANTYPKKAFRRIGFIQSMAVGANAIGEMYLAKYRIPSEGYEIALRLVGVMDSGMHTTATVVTTVITD